MATNALRNWNFEVPEINRLIAPIQQGYQDYRKQEQLQVENQRADEQLGMQRTKLGMERERFDSAKEAEVKRRMGGLALLAMQDEKTLPDRWQQILALHPNAASLPAHYRDPKLGAMALLGDAGMADDYIKLRIQQQAASQAAAGAARDAQLHPLRMDLLKAQAAQAGRRDELGEVKSRILRDMFPTGAPPAPGSAAPPAAGGPPGTVITPSPMSYQSAPDPNIIQTQASAPQAQGGGGVFQSLTPGQRAGVALGIAGFGDAGKIVADADPAKLQNKTRGEIEEKMMGSLDVAGRLREIQSAFRPEFQTIENRLGYSWTSFIDKFKAGQAIITPEQRAELQAYATYRSDAADNLNNYIKFITGAAMTNAEAERIQKGMPNAGTGLFDGDSPTEFKAKLDAALNRTKMAIARYNYLRQQGFANISPDEAAVRVPINNMPKIYNQRGAVIEKEIRARNPGIDDGVLRQQTRARLNQEFGI